MNTKNGKRFMGQWLFLLGLFLGISFLASAQDGEALADDSDVFESAQIDVDGSFQRRETPAERIAKQRRKMERQLQESMDKKVEKIRVRQERRLSKKLHKALNGSLKTTDGMDGNSSIMESSQEVVSPAPPPTPVNIQVVAPTFPEKNSEEKSVLKGIRLIPYAGVRQYHDDFHDISLESRLNIGMSVENRAAENLILGIGVDYSAVDMNIDGYENEAVAYNNLNLHLLGKVYFGSTIFIKPFVGFQFAYNRSFLKFKNRQYYHDPHIWRNGRYYNNGKSSDVVASNLEGIGLLGMEVELTRNIAFNLDFRYARALTNGFENNSREDYTFFPNTKEEEERRLKDIGARIEGSSKTSFNFGLVVQF